MSRPGFVLEVDDRTPPLRRPRGRVGSGWRASRSARAWSTRRSRCPAVPRRRRGDPARAAATRSTASRCRRCCAPGMRLTIAFDDLSLPLPPMASAGHPPADHRAGPRRMAAEAGVDDVELIAANALHRRMTAGRAQGTSSASGCSARSTRRATLYNFDAEDRDEPAHLGHDRPGRGRRDQQAGRRVRPAGLRQRQPRRDGRRPQVGGDRAGVVQVAAAPPQQPNDGALAVVHGPQELAAAPRRPGGWAGCSPTTEGLPDRDDAQQRRLPVAVRASCRSASGSGRSGPGVDARRRDAGSSIAPPKAAAQDVPDDAGAVRR